MFFIPNNSFRPILFENELVKKKLRPKKIKSQKSSHRLGQTALSGLVAFDPSFLRVRVRTAILIDRGWKHSTIFMKSINVVQL